MLLLALKFSELGEKRHYQSKWNIYAYRRINLLRSSLETGENSITRFFPSKTLGIIPFKLDGPEQSGGILLNALLSRGTENPSLTTNLDMDRNRDPDQHLVYKCDVHNT